jgi:hypothetical protein
LFCHQSIGDQPTTYPLTYPRIKCWGSWSGIKRFIQSPSGGVMPSFYREIRFYPWPPGGQTLDFIETLCSQICVYKMIDCDSLTFMFWRM